MMRSKPFTLSALSIAMAAGLYACGGGGGGSDASPAGDSGGNTSGVTLSGIVSAPSVTAVALNKGLGDKLLDFFLSPAFAELTGLTALSGATVEIIELNSDGTEKNAGTPLFTTLTDAAGEYSFDDPAIVPGSRYLIKVKKGSLTIRAPLYASEVNVDPVTEAVVTKVLADVAAGTATTIDNFTPSELSALVTIVASNTNLSAADQDLATLVSSITTGTGLDTMTTDMVMTGDGDTSTTSQLGGDYHASEELLGFDVNFATNAVQFQQRYTSGTMTLNNGSFTASGSEEEHQLYATISLPPSVSTATIPATATGTYTGAYYQTLTNKLYFADMLAASSADGTLFAYAGTGSGSNWAEHVFGVAGKKLTAAPNLDGKDFHFIGLQHFMAPDESAPTTNAWFDAEAYNGSIDFSTATLSLTTSLMSVDLMDNISDDNGAWLVNDVFNGITYTVTSNGLLSVNSPDLGTAFLTGFVTGASGNYIASLFVDGGDHQGHHGILAIEKGSGLSTATLNGSYNTIAKCVSVSDTDGTANANAIHGLGTDTGVMTFNGAGTAGSSFSGYDSGFSANSGTITIQTAPYSGGNASFNYTVADNGYMTTPTGRGAVSANGNVFAITDAEPGQRCMYIGIKQ